MKKNKIIINDPPYTEEELRKDPVKYRVNMIQTEWKKVLRKLKELKKK